MRRSICLSLLMLSLVAGLFLQSPARAETTAERDQRMAWWRDARFGMFIHWGVYSVPAGVYDGHRMKRGGSCWMMNRGKIPVEEYKQYAKEFNPVKYDPDAWVKTAKDAGMKYIVFTTKHHDGFAMFDTKASTWDIVDATPYGKDVVKPLANACRKHGIKLGFYYSQAQDWVNPGGVECRKVSSEGWDNPAAAKIDAYTKKHLGSWDPIQTTASMDEYINKVAVPQVRELLTDYGDVAVVWWDTPAYMTNEYALKFQDLLKLQPGVISNDRLKKASFPGDFKTPEQKIPHPKELDGKDWEACMTMNGSWGYVSFDHKWKSPETLIRNLVDITSKGGNYLLNVGPTALGEFPPESVEALHKMGEWTKVNGEAVYGTQQSPWGLFPWGRCTCKATDSGTTLLYFSVFDWPADGKLMIPGLKNEVLASTLLATGETLKTAATSDGLTIILPSGAPDPIASVIRVEVKGPVKRNKSLTPKKTMKTGSID